MENADRTAAGIRVTLVGAGVNALLAITKVVFGTIGHSQALLADGIHSFSDLFTDALVLFAAFYGGQDADQDHPYGHRRIETAMTLGLAMFLAVVAMAIIYENILRLLSDVPFETPHPYVLIIACLSVVANECLYRYTKKVGEHIQSAVLVANAVHHRTDAASSIVVLVGVGGTSLGVHHLDAVAAIIVGLMIIKIGWQLGWSSMRELVDTAAPPELIAQIRRVIEGVPGVIALHQLRTRSMAGTILVDVHILVDSHISVSEGHYIGESVELTLLKEVELVTDVVVHIDSEDDEATVPYILLPTRGAIIAWVEGVRAQFQDIVIEDVTLHYMETKVNIDILLSQTMLEATQRVVAFAAQLEQAARSREEIGEISFSFRYNPVLPPIHANEE